MKFEANFRKETVNNNLDQGKLQTHFAHIGQTAKLFSNSIISYDNALDVWHCVGPKSNSFRSHNMSILFSDL